MVIKIWSEFRRRVKPILATLKADFHKEAKQSVLLDGLERLITKISGQNVENMNKYSKNMMTLVPSIKDTFTKDKSSATSGATPTIGRVTKLTKPVKVPTWSRSMPLETFMKQLQTGTKMNK